MDTPLRVLLVEDSEDDAALVERELRHGGLDPTIERVETSEAMSRALHSGNPDIILCDNKLPQFNATAALSLLQASGLDLPFIIVSGAIGEERAVELMRAGAHDYVMKENLKRLPAVVRREVYHAGHRRAHREAEKARQESEARYKALFASAAEGIAVADLETMQQCYVNPAMCRMFGYTGEEFIRLRIKDIHPKESWGQIQVEFEAQARGEKTLANDLPCLRKDGTLFYANVSATPIVLDGRKCIVGFFTDITGRKQMEERLRTSEAVYKTLIETTNTGYVIIDKEGKVLDANLEYVRLTGHRNLDEIRGRSVIEWTADYEREKNAEAVAKCTKDGYIRNLEIDYIDKHGKITPIEINATVVEISGTPQILTLCRDITERKRAEAALEQQTQELAASNAELRQFAYVASHDLQEPLRMVTSYVQLLVKRYKGKMGPDADEFIEYAAEGAMRMEALINDLLEYSRIGMRGNAFEPTDCRVIFDQAVANLQVSIEENHAVVTCGPLPTVVADGVELTELFQNLIANGIKFHGKEPPRVRVEAKQKNHDWLFSVRDQGIGIDPQFFDRIFVIFQRLHARSEYPGTGMGLSICKKIVERHGGRIWAESQPGKGSTFYFTIPEGQGKNIKPKIG